MVDKKEINRLNEYRCQINNNVMESIKDSATKLNDVMAMLGDLQNINEVLVTSLAETSQENQSQSKDIIILKNKIESMEEVVNNAVEKEKIFANMDLSTAKVSALLASLEERENKLSIAETKLAQDRQIFEQEKEGIISARVESEEKANRYLQEKNDAIKSRDIAITERDKALDIKKKAEEERMKVEKDLVELREELAEYSNAATQDEQKLNETIELMEWYRNYAIDRKIVDFFRNKNEKLDGHYYTFLNNPDKLEEIHIHFPNYVIEEESNESKESEHMEEYKEVITENVDGDNKKALEGKVKKDKKDKKNKKDESPKFVE